MQDTISCLSVSENRQLPVYRCSRLWFFNLDLITSDRSPVMNDLSSKAAVTPYAATN